MTLKDIGKEAGVSSATVSNVINGNHNKVSQKTIEKVNTVIKKYNYVPNATARSLAMKQSKIINLFLPSMGYDSHIMKSPYHAQIVGVLERVVRSRGYYLMIRCIETYGDMNHMLRSWNVDGLIFSPSTKAEIEFLNENITLPSVFLDSYMENIEMSNVSADQCQGGYLATNHLLKNGHRKIAFVGTDVEGIGFMDERYNGYKKAFEEMGLEVRPEWKYEAELSYPKGIEMGKKLSLSKEGFTAIFAPGDLIALGITEGLQSQGIRIPEDISIIGFDNLVETNYSTPKLTTIEQNVEQKVIIATNHLIDKIEGKTKEIINIKTAPLLIEKESVRSI